MNAKSSASPLTRVWSRAKQLRDFVRAYGVSSLNGRYRGAHEYQAWIASYDTITDTHREQIRQELSALPYQPLISVVLPVHNTPEHYLREAIDSVRAQLYQHWELCIVDDCSAHAAGRELIEGYARQDSRIKYRFLTANVGIARTTNMAVELSRGEYIGFLDHDDLLREHSLSVVIRELNSSSEAELIFSDEDRLSPRGQRYKPYFKGGWNPELMLSHNAVCHFMVVRSRTFRALGGMRCECDGAQDWDLALRVAEFVGSGHIRHIPQILYHWRESPSSTARTLSAKPYVHAAQQRVVKEHLSRQGERLVDLERLPHTSMLRPRFAITEPPPTVSLIVLGQILDEEPEMPGWIERSAASYGPTEILVVDPVGEALPLDQYLVARKAPKSSARARSAVGFARDYARTFNRGAAIARGSVLCFMNHCAVSSSADWLKQLVAHALRPSVGAVGPLLLSERNRVQSAGLLMGATGIQPLFQGVPGSFVGDMYRLAVARDVSALPVTCLTLRKPIFQKAGGFHQEPSYAPSYDVDLSLRLRELGYRLVVTPSAKVQVRGIAKSADAGALPLLDNHRLSIFQRDSAYPDPFWSPHLLANGTLAKAGAIASSPRSL